MGKKKDKQKAKKKEKNSKQGKNRKNFVPQAKRGKGNTKAYKHWDKYFQEFNDALKPRGLFTRDVDGDGNCLFRSIADQLDGDESLHKKYRDMAVEHITEKKDLFALYLEEGQNIDKILKDMQEDGNWGDFFELIALSAVLDIRFCLHLKDQEKPFFVQSFEKTKCKKLCHLAYHIDQHYSSVRNLDDDTKLPAAPINVVIRENDDSSSSSDDDSDKEDDDKEVDDLAEGIDNLKIDKKKSKNSKAEKTEKKEVKQESSDDESSEEEQKKSKWNKKSKKNKNDSDSDDDKKNGKDQRKKNKKKK